MIKLTLVYETESETSDLYYGTLNFEVNFEGGFNKIMRTNS
jgi:hypothetical protein